MLCLMHSSVVFSRHHVNLSILPTIVPKKVLHKKNKKKPTQLPVFEKKRLLIHRHCSSDDDAVIV